MANQLAKYRMALVFLLVFLLNGVDMPVFSDKYNAERSGYSWHISDKFDSGVKLLSSSVSFELCEISRGVNAENVTFRAKRPTSACGVTCIPRALSVKDSMSQSPDEIRLEVRPIADVELRFSIMLSDGRNLQKNRRLEVLSVSRYPHFKSSRFVLFVTLQSSTPHKILMTCRQSSREETIPDLENEYLSSYSPVENNVFLNVHFTFLLHSSHPQYPTVSESSSAATGRRLRNTTISKFRFCATKLVNESEGVLETRDDKDFPHYPFSSKIFSSLNHQFNSFHHQNYSDNIIFNLFIKDALYKCIIFLAIIYKCFPQNKEAKKGDDNIVYFRICTTSFFLKWNWKQQQNEKELSRTGPHKTERKAAEQTDSESLFGQTSMLTILGEYILRPWLLKAQPENSRPSRAPSKPSNCISFETSLCSSCRSHLDHFRSHTQHSIQVNPVTSFLPNPTCDPALDLAHVGYRLATLSALPASVPVSRIKLADAGFYFRGQNDEVMCYSCEARHSGWTREDNPLEIHRRLSPNCEHMLQRDRELSALARSSNLGGGGQGSEALGAGVNTPVEDGEGSHSRARQPAPTSRETSTPSSHRPVVCNGAGSSHSPAGRGDLVTGSAASRGRGAHESFPNSGTGHANPGTHPGTALGPGNRTGNIPNTVSTTTSTATSSRASSGVSVVSDGSNRRTSSAAFNASSSPRSGGGGGGGQGNAAAAHAGARPVFPRARLDLGGAVYPMYQDMASRRRTFSHWDDSQAPPLDHVILCGMFYAGYADCVRCFYCGVGLKHWVATDDVWTEHVRWRPSCEYLRAVKGDAFIRDTQRRLGIETSRDQSGSARHGTDVPPAARIDNSVPPAPAQGQQPTTTSSTSTNTAVTSTRTTTAATATTSSVPAARASTASSTAATAASTGQAGATAATSSAPSNEPAEAREEGGGAERGGSLTAVSSEAEDHERLARLQAENRALSQRFQCKVCHQAAIDTILMPCGHLVVCENCARSVTSCPLCQDTIRATARVHMG